MEQFFNNMIDTILGAPHMIYISFGVAIVFILGGILLYKNRERIKLVKGMRWPGVTCALLGCASLVTNVVQYMAR